MDTQSPSAAPPKPEVEPSRRRPTPRGLRPGRPASARLIDAGLLLLFLGLTFLLGVFPLKDADIFWHLRTGQLIRQTGQVPTVDHFTFTRENAAWIDLHWIFQVGTSWLYERGGAVALNLAKCVVTCLAVLILVTNRRRDWPLWVALVAWLPALLVLGGRMYVRPETLSLLYLSIFLAVLTRWDRRPYLVALLPFVQVAWVNSHGLFVLGPILLVMALLDAAIRPGSLAPGPLRWWRIAGLGSLATFAACLINPYGVGGAVYPIQLAGTMTNRVFSLQIAELTPIPVFIERAGLRNLPLQLHFLTMALGALSFLVPLVWSVAVRFSGALPTTQPPPDRRQETADGPSRTSRKKASGRTKKQSAKPPEPASPTWRLSLFRLLLFGAFSYLSLQATRNSHQFAAVVGSVTAWNFAEWAAAVSRRRARIRGPETVVSPPGVGLRPRLFAAGAILAVLAWVGSGLFYAMTGEGRTIHLGEEPLFFPHEAAKVAGDPEMPPRFLSFHNGHASLFEFYHGPERKVFTDPRLEVAGAALFQAYMELDGAIRKNEPGWRASLDRIGRPIIMVDHENNNSSIGATLLADSRWRCVWFDAIVAMYVHDSAAEAVRRHAVDFPARHFRPDGASRARPPKERIALANAFRYYLMTLPSHRSDLVWPFVWLGLDEGRAILRESPDSALGWKMLGQVEIAREPAPTPTPSPRYRLPFDPVADLSVVRATHALRRAVELDPDDLTSLMRLAEAYDRRAMYEEALDVLDRLEDLAARHPAEKRIRAEIAPRRGEYRDAMGEPPSLDWRNLAEFERLVTSLLSAGRVRTAADVLERANPREGSSWEVLDRMARLRLHLGEPARARAIWQRGIDQAPDPATAAARIGATYLAEADFDAARREYRRALAARPDHFEACYSLAVLEADAGDAAAASELARKAVAAAPDDRSRAVAGLIARAVERFAPTQTGGRP